MSLTSNVPEGPVGRHTVNHTELVQVVPLAHGKLLSKRFRGNLLHVAHSEMLGEFTEPDQAWFIC